MRLWLVFLVACAPATIPDAPPSDKNTPILVPAATPDPDPTPALADESTHAPCSENGCLRARHFLGRYSKEVLTPLLAPDVTIDNGYAIYTIRYLSVGGELGATIAVPLTDPPPGGWHIVVNNHGTTGVADVCAITGTTWGSGLAGEFGARGMIGVAPDYEGLGEPGVHPYLVTESEGRTALDAVRAAAAFAKAVDLPISHRYAVVGLSQGGHAALAAAALHRAYAPELDIRAFAAAGPATVRRELWAPALAIPGEHIAYHALIAYAWMKVYGAPSPFLPGIAIDDVMETACAFSPNPKTKRIVDLLPHDASQLFTTEFASGYGGFHEYFDKNRAKPYDQTAPLRIYQGDADTTVPEAHTRAYVDELRAAGQTVDYVVVPGGEHTNVAFSFVAQKQSHSEDAVEWLKQALSK